MKWNFDFSNSQIIPSNLKIADRFWKIIFIRVSIFCKFFLRKIAFILLVIISISSYVTHSLRHVNHHDAWISLHVKCNELIFAYKKSVQKLRILLNLQFQISMDTAKRIIFFCLYIIYFGHCFLKFLLH